MRTMKRSASSLLLVGFAAGFACGVGVCAWVVALGGGRVVPPVRLLAGPQRA